MTRSTKIVVAATALAALAAWLVPMAFGTSLAPTERASVASLHEVGDSGVGGLAAGYELLEQHSLRLHVTLACNEACPGGADGSRVRIVFTSGACNKPAGRRYPVAAGRMGPGGLNLRRNLQIDPNDDPIGHSRSVRARWDPDGDGKFALAACGHDRVLRDTSQP